MGRWGPEELFLERWRRLGWEGRRQSIRKGGEEWWIERRGASAVMRGRDGDG